MIALTIPPRGGRALRVLCIGAHCDDIEIGCGGTLLTLTEQSPDVDVRWIVLSSDVERRREAMASADLFLAGAQVKDVAIETFRSSFFPYVGEAVKEYFEALKRETVPDVIFTHYRHDLHQDHRVVSELTWNTFRDHLILEYEIAKYDGDLGSPNLFVSLDAETCRRKIDYILRCFTSQQDKHWFAADLFLALSRLRGMEAHAASGLAEAFYGRKLVLGVR